MPKKSEKKEAPPEPEPEPELKLPKKKPSRQIPKEEPKEEESPFGKIKLKKAETVKRTWDDPGMESVDLKHHEFERAPQEEEVYKMTDDSGGCDMIIYCSLRVRLLSSLEMSLKMMMRRRKRPKRKRKSLRRRNLRQSQMKMNLLRR